VSKAVQQAEYVEGESYVVEVKRTQRSKTASLKVEEGQVIIVVPKDLSTERIEQVIADKHPWIMDKILAFQLSTPASDKQYVSGESFPYLGRNYRLKLVTGSYESLKLIHGRLQLTLQASPARTYFTRMALVDWYKRNAKRKFDEKVKRYAATVGVKPKSVSVKSFKSRWGSCSAEGDVEFNWVVVMAPNRVVDYIVIHELCHLLHHDHSSRFWKEVARVMPDYKACKDWLKVNGHTLVV
jgi:predicted metal-dependent hydrolase